MDGDRRVSMPNKYGLQRTRPRGGSGLLGLAVQEKTDSWMCVVGHSHNIDRGLGFD